MVAHSGLGRSVEEHAQLSATATITTVPTIHRASLDEGRAMLDRRAQKELGLDGEEFLRRYDEDAFQDTDEETADKVNRLALLIPFVRAR